MTSGHRETCMITSIVKAHGAAGLRDVFVRL
jgi:hypothetical protein